MADSRLPRFRDVLPLLAAVALLELVLGRIYSRVSIYLPLRGSAAEIADALSFSGFFLFNLTALLLAASYLLLIWELWKTAQARRTRVALLGPAVLLALAVATGLDPSPLLTVLIDLVFLGLVATVTVRLWVGRGEARPSLLALAFLATYLAWGYYALTLLFQQVTGVDPPKNYIDVFRFAEAAAVAVAFVVFGGIFVPTWWALRPGGKIPPLLPLGVGGILGGLFSVIFLKDPSVTSAISAWALGFYLYLPWPIYAAGLAVAAATVLGGLRGVLSIRTGLGLLFCFVAGFELKLAFQHLEAALGLLLLFSPAVGRLLED